MDNQFTVPEEFEASFRRILPYLMAPLQKNSQVLESVLLFLKLGGDKMARIAIDALNVTQRLQDAAVKKQLREQELLYDNAREELDDDEDESDNDNDGDNAAADDDDLDSA